jgi:prepilin-type N-terminal cleavage/methylation domain-containing protein
MKKNISGFTLLEMMISMALLGIILTVVFNFFNSSLKVTSIVSAQSQVQTEMRSVASMITEDVQRAIYVFPPCGEYKRDGTGKLTITGDITCTAKSSASNTLNVSWSKFSLASTGETIKNPVTDSYDWFVGAGTTFTKTYPGAPILAMITSPRDPNLPCYKGFTTKLVINPEGCYTFIAYYPIKRSRIVLSVTDGQLTEDSQNSNKWVLMQYRRNLSANLEKTTTGSNYVAAASELSDTLANIADRIPWLDTGCLTTAATSTPLAPLKSSCSSLKGLTAAQAEDVKNYMVSPNPDPDERIQSSNVSIPMLNKGEGNTVALDRFKNRIIATRDWLNGQDNTGQGSGKIILDYLKADSDGFGVTYSNDGSIDERGVNQVMFNLQMDITRTGTSTLYPAKPLKFVAVPRNIIP